MKTTSMLMMGLVLPGAYCFGDIIANYNFNNRLASTCPVEAQRAETILLGEKIAMFITTDKNQGSATAYLPNPTQGESGPALIFKRVSGGDGLYYEPFERDGALSSTGTQSLVSPDVFLSDKNFDVSFLMKLEDVRISLWPEKMYATLFSVSDTTHFISQLEACNFTPSKGEYALRYVYRKTDNESVSSSNGKDKEEKEVLESERLQLGVWYTIKLEYRDTKVKLIVDGKAAGELASDGPRISGTTFAFGPGFDNQGGSNWHKLFLDELMIRDSHEGQ